MEDSVSILVSSLVVDVAHRRILNNINLQVDKKQSVVILGMSGVGKSILIKTMMGLVRPSSGSIKINGQETINLSYSKRMDVLKNCGFLFQNGALFDSYNIMDNITFFAKKLFKLSYQEAKNLAIQKLLSVGLSENIIYAFPSELSGGMYKRVALARAVCHNPKIIFFDEPTTGLDPVVGQVIVSLMQKLRKDLNATMVTVTHDIDMASFISDKIIFLSEGRIIWEGKKDQMFSSQNKLIRNFVAAIGKKEYFPS